MRIAHLADLHLGYRAYNRTAHGINVRERDVGAAFAYAVDRLLEIKPDVIVVAGDIFHTSRPSNTAITWALQQFGRLASLSVPIIITSGNHDQPNTVETGDPVQILAGIPHVIYLPWTECETYQLGIQWSAYPYGLTGALQPQQGYPRIAIVHGEPPQPDLARQFDLVLMGHYHIHDVHGPNAFYSGSLERCSSNIWIEESGKGFLVHEIFADRAISSQYIDVPTRPVYDLPRIFAKNLTPEEVSEQIRLRAEAIPGGIDGKIVRQVIVDCPTSLQRALDHKLVRDLKARALHYQITPVRPARAVKTASTEMPRTKTLEQELADFIMGSWEPGDAGIDRGHVLELALAYLAEAKEIGTGADNPDP
jgi:exonuclease SbcD